MTQSSSQFNLDDDDDVFGSFDSMIAFASEHEEEGEDTSVYFSSSSNGASTAPAQPEPAVSERVEDAVSDPVAEHSQYEADPADDHVETVDTQESSELEQVSHSSDYADPSSVTPVTNGYYVPAIEEPSVAVAPEPVRDHEPVREPVREPVPVPAPAPTAPYVPSGFGAHQPEEAEVPAVAVPVQTIMEHQEETLANTTETNKSSIVADDELVSTVGVVLNVVNAYRSIPENMRQSVAEFICRTGDIDVEDESRVIVEAIRTAADERAAVLNLHDMLLEKDRVERVLAIMDLEENALELLGGLAATMSNEDVPDMGNRIEFTRKVERMIEKIPSETIDYIKHTNKVLAAAAAR